MLFTLTRWTALTSARQRFGEIVPAIVKISQAVGRAPRGAPDVVEAADQLSLGLTLFGAIAVDEVSHPTPGEKGAGFGERSAGAA